MLDDAVGSSAAPATKMDFNEKFRKLHQLRQRARKENLEQVVEEDRKKKLPANYEAKKARNEWEFKEIEDRKKAEEDYIEFEIIKSLNVRAVIADNIECKRKRKKNPDLGFSSDASRLTAALKPYDEAYKKMREVVGDGQFYPAANTLLHGSHYPTSLAMEKLSQDVQGQANSRVRFHRRRMFDPDAPIDDYINEKNKKFNEKLKKYYGKYTEDIKEDLEGGTAVYQSLSECFMF